MCSNRGDQGECVASLDLVLPFLGGGTAVTGCSACLPAGGSGRNHPCHREDGCHAVNFESMPVSAQGREPAPASPLSTQHSDRMLGVPQPTGGCALCLGRRHLALSTNSIEKITSLSGMENLKILSLGRNLIKKIENLDAVADTLEELWMSYNVIANLVSACLPACMHEGGHTTVCPLGTRRRTGQRHACATAAADGSALPRSFACRTAGHPCTPAASKGPLYACMLRTLNLPACMPLK